MVREGFFHVKVEPLVTIEDYTHPLLLREPSRQKVRKPWRTQEQNDGNRLRVRKNKGTSMARLQSAKDRMRRPEGRGQWNPIFLRSGKKLGFHSISV